MTGYPVIKGNGWRAEPLFSAQEIRAMEAEAVGKYGFTYDLLMENAGASAARWLVKDCPTDTGFLLCCGPSNNGGDGLVIARYLLRAGCSVEIFLHSSCSAKPSELFRKNHQRLIAEGFQEAFKPSGQKINVLVDALYGTGFKGQLDDEASRMLSLYPEAKTVAVDLPSGLNPDIGLADRNIRKAEITLSFGALKKGFVLGSGSDCCGTIESFDIGLPFPANPETWRVQSSGKPQLKPAGAHKYENGHVIVVGGSAGMAGAATYAAKAAWKSGAGIISVFSPAGLTVALEKLAPFAVKAGFGVQNQPFFTPETVPEMVARISGKKCVLVVGPGAGTEEETIQALASLLKASTQPFVLDADGLRTVSLLDKDVLSRGILTPHAGELSRIAEMPVTDDLSRLDAARIVAQKTGALVLAKGNRPFLVTGSGVFAIDYDTAKFNRAGFGDVLAGAIGASLARKSEPWRAVLDAAFFLNDKASNFTELIEPEDLL